MTTWAVLVYYSGLMKTRFLFPTVALSAALASALPAGNPQAESPKRLLFITHSAGFKHEVLPHASQVVETIAPKYGLAATATDGLDLINKEDLGRFHALLFYTTGDLPLTEQQREAFLDFIRSGKAFIGVHSATDTWYEWEEYGKIIGGYFDGHPWNEEVGIRVENTQHPATAHLGESFRMADEIYQFKSFSRDRVNVLLSLDTSGTDMTKRGIKRTDGDFALAWTNTYGQGRIFYTALGHRPEVWDDPRFQEHLFGGILWALGER